MGNSRRDINESDKVRDTIIRACEIATKKFGYKHLGFLFICSDEQDMEKARLRLFAKWFKYYSEGIGSLNFRFTAHTKEYSNTSFCGGVLLNKDNPDFDLLMEDVRLAMNTNLGLDQG